jgi:hypothetical protein
LKLNFSSAVRETETLCNRDGGLQYEPRSWIHSSSTLIEFALTGILPPMTLVEITFELQSPLTAKQLSDLAEFANTYGLRRFRHDEAHNLITFEYDASRLRQSQVVHALAGANIAITRIVPQSGAEIIPA